MPLVRGERSEREAPRGGKAETRMHGCIGTGWGLVRSCSLGGESGSLSIDLDFLPLEIEINIYNFMATSCLLGHIQDRQSNICLKITAAFISLFSLKGIPDL